MANTIKRKIRFYRVDTGLDSNGKPIAFDPIPTLEHVDKLKWNISGRYWRDEEKLVSCWVDSKVVPCKIRLGIMRVYDIMCKRGTNLSRVS